MSNSAPMPNLGELLRICGNKHLSNSALMPNLVELLRIWGNNHMSNSAPMPKYVQRVHYSLPDKYKPVRYKSSSSKGLWDTLENQRGFDAE